MVQMRGSSGTGPSTTTDSGVANSVGRLATTEARTTKRLSIQFASLERAAS
jgi:hypothetical protein